MDDDPAPWNCFEDVLTAFLESHPDFDPDDAIEALIWGYEDEDSEDE